MQVIDLGAEVPYADGMAAMRQAVNRVDEDGPALLLLEHAPVITTTRTGGTAFVTSSAAELAAAGIELVETDRGGDVTFHGPGQLVGYPVLRLCPPGGRGDLLGYLRALEGALVTACVRLGVADAHSVEGATGVWCQAPVLGTTKTQESKLVAIGVGVGQGVTRHGFALNITTSLERYTRHIVPCGLVGRGVTSLERLVSPVPGRAEVARVVVEELGRALPHWARAA